MDKFEPGTVNFPPVVCLYCGCNPAPNEITGMPHCCDEAQKDYDDWAIHQEEITACLRAGCNALTIVDEVCTECGAREE